MHMKGQPERDFVVNLKYEGGYRFSSQASEDGRLHGDPYASDEPDPVGEASGPATPALLGSAVTHCLSASLLEALRHAHVEVLDFEAEAVAIVKPHKPLRRGIRELLHGHLVGQTRDRCPRRSGLANRSNG